VSDVVSWLFRVGKGRGRGLLTSSESLSMTHLRGVSSAGLRPGVEAKEAEAGDERGLGDSIVSRRCAGCAGCAGLVGWGQEEGEGKCDV